MTPLPVDNTARTVVRYSSGGNTHDLVVRHSDTAAATLIGSTVDAFLTALDPNLWGMVVLDAIRYPINTNISAPSILGIEGNTYGTGSPSIEQEPDYIDFVGRSLAGRRVRVTVFGPTDLGGNYRVSIGEFASIATALAALQSEPTVFWAIDGTVPNWKSYANTGVNSYWQKQQRS